MNAQQTLHNSTKFTIEDARYHVKVYFAGWIIIKTHFNSCLFLRQQMISKELHHSSFLMPVGQNAHPAADILFDLFQTFIL